MAELEETTETEAEERKPAVTIPPQTVIIVGCGGVGGWVARGLIKMLDFVAEGSTLILVDGDSYEPKNHDRQVFAKYGNKAQVLSKELVELSRYTTVIALDKWVVESLEARSPAAVAEDNDDDSDTGDDKVIASALLDTEGTILIPAVDNWKVRKVLIDAAQGLSNIDVFMSGNDDASYGTLYHYRRRDGKDVTVNPVDIHPELANPQDRNPGELSCEERAAIDGGTQLLATNMGVAAYTLAALESTMIKGLPVQHNQVYFDLLVGAEGVMAMQDSWLTDEGKALLGAHDTDAVVEESEVKVEAEVG